MTGPQPAMRPARTITQAHLDRPLLQNESFEATEAKACIRNMKTLIFIREPVSGT